MSEDDGLLLAFGIILLGMSTKRQIEWGSGWIWPIPDIAATGVAAEHVARQAVISQEFRGKGAKKTHYGVDLMYRNPVGVKPVFMAPAGVPVLAARAGTLWSAKKTPRGFEVVIDHGKPWATYYLHMSDLDPEILAGVQGASKPIGAAPMVVAAGQRLGTMGADPLDPSRVVHLHFAAWYQGAGDAASVDPAAEMASWGRRVWTP